MSETGDGMDHLRIPYDKIKFGNKLEVQGYGTVFEGEFDDQRVALKQLNITNLANIKPKLLAEILTISKFRQHPNLVALLGFCDEKSNEITLVYEYVASGNLEDKMRKRLTTIQRFEICLGAARGLCYLHTGVESISIVHGNIKLSKILLNSDANSSRFEAKVSSFGLSKIVPGKAQKVLESSDEDAEKPTKESDVYSFGVLLLIVLCGVSELVDTDDYQERHVSELVPKKMKQNKLRKTVHFDIRKEIKTEALETYAVIACQCVMENPDDRPDMVKVVEELEKALRLQGGEVTYVQIPGSGNIAGATVMEPDISNVEEDEKDFLAGEDNGEKNTVEATNTESSNNDQVLTKEILNSKMESNEEENKSKIPTEDVYNEMSTIDPETTKDQTTDYFESENKSTIIEEKKQDDQMIEIATASESSNAEIDTVETTESVPVQNHIEDAENEVSKDDPTTENEILNDLNSEKESNIMTETDEEDKSKITIKDAHNETSTNDQETTEITTSESRDFSFMQESVPDRIHIEDTKNENSNGDPDTETEILNDLNSKNESNITVEDEEKDKTKITVKDAQKEMSTTDPESPEETKDDIESNINSKITEENKEDDESLKITTVPESSNGDTSTSTSQEVHGSKMLQSSRRSFSEVNEDELERLRIPFVEIKFGQKIDVHGYGTMFEGEYNHQQVALKRLNITNLQNIKPKLLSAILTIYRFRQHPNLVALIGFCDENNKEMILVYEYVSGGNLADKMSKHLTTIQRLQICLGAARGLEYLHSDDESGIIHGNIRLPKILLNSDSNSSYFDAKVSGFGLPKLLPGHVEIAPKSMDPVYAATGKLTKESDVYTFGVLLLEVLCGVPELVDTDDYQERHVTELVPKRLEQNMLRKIVHFDNRDEITTESLEAYAKIACRCVRKNPEERPIMPEVVVELEKALRLQGRKVSDVQILGSKVAVGEDDHEGDGNGETLSSNITKEETKISEETIDENNKDINLLGKSIPVPISGGNHVETEPENAETKNGSDKNDPESTEEITVDLESTDEPKLSVANEVSNESETPSSKADNGNGCNSAMQEHGIPLPDERGDYEDAANKTNHMMVMSSHNPDIKEIMAEKVSDVQPLGSSNGNGLPEVSVGEGDQVGDDNGETMSSTITTEESKVIEETTDDIALEDAKKENVKVPESTEEITVDLKSNEESKIIGEDEVNNQSNTTFSSSSAMQEPLPDERSASKEKGTGLMMNTHNPHIMDVQSSAIPDGNGKAGSLNIEKPELTVDEKGGDSSSYATQIHDSESKRSNSTSSESSNGDDTTPSDRLLPKSPDNVKKTSRGSSNCCYCFCSCSWWRFISDRVKTGQTLDKAKTK